MSRLAPSLRTGDEPVEDCGPARQRDAPLVCHGDQPLLRLAVILALPEAPAHGGAVAVRPAYRDTPGEPGLPLLVDRGLWKLAGEMRGESGFAPVLESHRITVRTVQVGGSNPDVDTPEDLARLEDTSTAAAG